MTERRFPRSPDIHRPPLQAGLHPFADEAGGDVSPPASDNLFASSASSEPPPHAAPDYICTLPDRSRKVLILGMLATGFAVVNALIVCVAFATGKWTENIFYCLPASFFTLVFAVPTVTMGGSDLRAIRAGAMALQGLTRSRIGWWLGAISLLTGLIPALFGLVAVFINSFL